MSLALQYTVIALLVLASAGAVLQRYFPGVARRLRLACAAPLVREGRPAWMRALGRRLAPVVAMSEGGCGHCSGCEPG